jgi:hypothetical protein
MYLKEHKAAVFFEICFLVAYKPKITQKCQYVFVQILSYNSIIDCKSNWKWKLQSRSLCDYKKMRQKLPRNSLSAVGIIIFRSYLYSGSGRTEVDRDKFRCRRFQKSEISLWDNFICETLKHFYLYCQKRHCCWLVFFTLRDISHCWLKFFKARAKVQNCFLVVYPEVIISIIIW